jgi:hypothetical protein
VWLVQSALGLLYWTRTGATSGGASWIFRVHIPFTHLPPFIHWDLKVDEMTVRHPQDGRDLVLREGPGVLVQEDAVLSGEGASSTDPTRFGPT